jgi:hypothetical protein
MQPMTVEWGYAVRDLAATHDFDDEVKRATAALAADRCSNPYCRALTSGPANDRTKSLNVGVTAPISAMSPGGCRHDARLSDAERHDQGNAIWLCYSCARQVDNDVARYPAELLRSWKTKTGRGE